jgi:hypothetical protein
VKCTIRFSSFDVQSANALREFEAVAEADIREAHREASSRPKLTGIPAYIYEAAVHAQDTDQKAHEEEIAAQYRALDGTSPY